jgi:hypothetical protein
MSARQGPEDAYRRYLLENRPLLEEAARESDIAFFKVMKNLVFGTNRSIFTAVVGRDQEGIEKWSPGKPLNRVNIRATVASLMPDMLADSIFINTYRDDRELAIHVLADRGAPMYPASFLAGPPDPLQTPMALSILLQALIRTIAREYDARLFLSPFPLAGRPLPADPKARDLSAFLRALEPPVPAEGDPAEAFSWLFRSRVRHVVVFLVSHEGFFQGDERQALLRDLRAFSMTNDVIFTPLGRDPLSELLRSPGPVEVQWPGGGILARNEAEKRRAAARLREERIKEFARLEENGLRVCPLTAGRPDWYREFAEFFRNRVVLK